MTHGLAFAQGLAAREMRRGLEPAFKSLQRQTLASLGATKGWSSAQLSVIQGIGVFINRLGSLDYHIEEYRKHLEGIFRLSKYGFAAGTGAILGFAAAASPQALKTLTDSFGWLSAEIGTVFVPYVAKAAYVVQQLARAFHGLSPGTKDFIGKYLVIGTVLAGVGVGVNALIFAFSGLTKVLSGLATAYAFVAASARGAAVAQATSVTAGAAAAAGAAGGAAAGGAAAGGAAAAGGGFLSKLGGLGKLGRFSGLAKGLGVGAVIVGITELVSWLAGKFAKIGSPGAGDEGLKLSAFGQPWVGKVEEAWRAAQMNVAQSVGPAGEQLKIQRDSYLKLQEIAANTGDKGVGPAPSRKERLEKKYGMPLPPWAE